MTAGKRRVIVCDDATWARLKQWAEAHGVIGYRNHFTVAPVLRALLQAAERKG